jgi:hypothetical protein
MPVVLGPYPLCPICRETNGGLVAVRHPQVHLRAHGKEACVDRGIAGLLAGLWAVCDTRSCCEDDDGRAYVVPTAETGEAAVRLLTDLGLRPAVADGIVFFRMRESFRLDDPAWVRRQLRRPTGVEVRWQASGGGFERSDPPGPSTAEPR